MSFPIQIQAGAEALTRIRQHGLRADDISMLVGASGERADVFVSRNGINFVFLGTALDSSTTAFDLASIGWTGAVVAVKIVGLDNFGGSPGFDVDFIQVLPGSAR